MTQENVQANDNGEQTAEDTQVNQQSQKTENMIPKSRFDQVNEQKKQYEQDLNEVADMLLKDVPEDYQDLFSDLPAKQKVAKIKSAQAKGLFSKQPVSSPEPERPGPSTNDLDFSKMSIEERMNYGYKKG